MLFLMFGMHVRLFPIFQGPAELSSSPARKCFPPLNFITIGLCHSVGIYNDVHTQLISPNRVTIFEDHYGHWRPHAFLLKTERCIFVGWINRLKKGKRRKLSKGFIFVWDNECVFMVSLTSGNIKPYSLEKPCSRYTVSSLPRDLQRKITLPATALLKSDILTLFITAPLSQWAFDPKSLKP